MVFETYPRGGRVGGEELGDTVGEYAFFGNFLFDWTSRGWLALSL